MLAKVLDILHDRRPADHVRASARRPTRGARTPAHHPVVIVGAGPVGLVAALDLASKGHRSVVIDKKSNLSDGSRAICWAKRTLEIMDRLGVGQALVDKGVTWKTGKVFFDTRQVYEFDLLPEDGHRRPAFINLQQYYFEHFCIEAAAQDRPDRHPLAGGGDGHRADRPTACCSTSARRTAPTASPPTG